MITLEKIRALCKTLPGTTEGTSYGTPGFRVAKKLFARLHGKEDAIVLILNTVQEQQDLIASDPMSFYITDHYEGYAAILVRPTADDDAFFELLELACRRVARRRDTSEYDSQSA